MLLDCQVFVQDYRMKQFSCGYKFLTEGVFLTHVASTIKMCLTNCVG